MLPSPYLVAFLRLILKSHLINKTVIHDNDASHSHNSQFCISKRNVPVFTYILYMGYFRKVFG